MFRTHLSVLKHTLNKFILFLLWIPFASYFHVLKQKLSTSLFNCFLAYANYCHPQPFRTQGQRQEVTYQILLQVYLGERCCELILNRKIKILTWRHFSVSMLKSGAISAPSCQHCQCWQIKAGGVHGAFQTNNFSTFFPSPPIPSIRVSSTT